jgi:hypothetical protein
LWWLAYCIWRLWALQVCKTLAETLAAKLGVSIDLSSVADKEPMIAYVHENLCFVSEQVW